MTRRTFITLSDVVAVGVVTTPLVWSAEKTLPIHKKYPYYHVCDYDTNFMYPLMFSTEAKILNKSPEAIIHDGNEWKSLVV